MASRLFVRIFLIIPLMADQIDLPISI
jgi:hypothetical protein